MVGKEVLFKSSKMVNLLTNDFINNLFLLTGYFSLKQKNALSGVLIKIYMVGQKSGRKSQALITILRSNTTYGF